MIKAIGDTIILKEVKEEEKTKAGIILNSNSSVASPIYEIVSIGDNLSICKDNEPIPFSVGDRVLIDKRSGCPITDNENNHYWHVKCWEIAAIVNN